MAWVKVARSHDCVDRPRAQIQYQVGGTLTLKAYDDGVQIIPTSATISVKRPTGAPCTVPVVNVAVTPAGDGTMTYALTAGNADLLQGQFGAYAPWTAEWKINYGSGAGNSSYIQPFDVVRWPISNVVTTADLLFHHADLASAYMSGETSAQVYINEAYVDIYQMLSSNGKRAYLCLDSEELRGPITHLALEKFYRPRVKAKGDRWDGYATMHKHQFESWFEGRSFTYDWDQTGTADPSEVNRPFGLAFKV